MFRSLTPLVFLFLFAGINSAMAQSVGIAGTAITPDAQSILDIQSTTKGVLLPRMTTAQATTLAASLNAADAGMTVYDTDLDLYKYWDGTALQWQTIANGSSIPTASDYIANNTVQQVAANFNIDGNGTLSDLALTGGDITSTGLLRIGSTTNVRVRLDTDANGAGEFQVTNNGGSTSVFSVTESGNVVATGSGEFDGNITLVGDNRDIAAANNLDITGTSGIDIQVDSDANSANSEFRILNDVNTEILKLQEDGGIFFSGLVAPGSNILQADATGQVTRSTLDPANIISSVVAGEGLVGGGTSGDVTLDVDADNGLNVDVVNDKVQLGGALTEATTITHGANDLTLNLNSTGEFVVQDNGTDHFKVAANGDAIFGSDTYFKDANTGGTDLVIISDAGGGGNDGRIEIFSNGTVNHTIHGDGNTVFNEQGLIRDFRIESDNVTNMFLVDASTDRVGIGTATPDQALHVIGDVRVSGLSAGGNVQADVNGDLIISNDVIAGDGDYIQNQYTAAQSASSFWISNDGRMDAGLTVGDGITLDNNNLNTGTVADGALAFGSTSGEGIASKRNAGGNQNGLDLYTNAINRMAITNAGNIGIGTTAPDRKVKISGSGWTALEIEETGASDAALELTSAGGSSYVYAQNAGHLGLQSPAGQEIRLLTNGGTERMRIESGGNVGIGTDTPNAKLNVGDANGATIYLTREDNVTVANDVLGSLLFDSTDDTQPSDNDASAVIRGHASQDHGNSNKGGYLTFLTKDNVLNATAATERMRIAANGNVGIGTDAPTQTLDVEGQIRMRGTSGTAGYVPVSSADGTMIWTDPATISTAQDNDWHEVGGSSAPNSINDNIFTQGNVGIGSNNPDRNLKVSGSGWTAVEIESTGGTDDAALELTSAGGSSYVFTDNTGYLGLQSPAGQEIRLLTNGGSEQMRIESGGNVGIGTTGPTSVFQVTTAQTGNAIKLHNTALANGSLIGFEFGKANSNNNMAEFRYNHASDGNSANYINLGLWGNPNILNVVGTGNVGIGTTSPSDKLHINNGNLRLQSGYEIYFSDNGQIRSSDNNHRIVFDRSNNEMEFYEWGDFIYYTQGSNERMRLTGVGNLGIGTTNPGSKLHVVGQSRISGTTRARLTFEPEGGVNNLWNIDNSGGVMRFFRENYASSGAGSGGLVRMVITDAGRVGIANTNPQAMLHVSGSGVSQTNAYGWLNNAGNTGSCGSCAASYSIQADGRIRATEFNAISDMRIKNVVAHTTTSALLNTVNKLKVTKYSYIDHIANGGLAKEGFIAQEVEKVIPEAVKRSEDHIPSVFSNSSSCAYNAELNRLTVSMENAHGLVMGDEVKVFDNEGDRYSTVVEVVNETTFVLSEWEESVERLFVFGKKVDDFRAIDYDQLFSIGIGAIQELSKKNDALTAKVSELEKTVENYGRLEAAMETMKAQIDQLDSDMNAKAEK